MFVTILFGDNQMEMFNLNCKLINFIQHLKKRCGLDSKDFVELMDSRGQMMNLETRQHSMALASSVLAERHNYIALQVLRNSETGGRKYISLVNNYSQGPPELTELLKKLSNPDIERERRTKRQVQKRRNLHKKTQAK